jgi:hypothetical protein
MAGNLNGRHIVQITQHRRRRVPALMSPVDDWIIHFADPLGPRTASPRRPLPLARIGDLIERAEAHGVLGALLQNFPAFKNDGAFGAGYHAARDRNRANTAFSLLLRHEADVLMADLRGVSAAVVKGPVFAHSLYPAPSLRCFTDIDILAAPEALPRIDAVLADHGFQLAETHRRECKWLHRDNASVMVEVQTDLIHADSLHEVISLPYQAIAAAPEATEALLLVALVHGGGHQYERLQQVVDICQAGRALKDGAEQRRFEDMVRAANARFVAAAGLLLAGRVFDEPRCREIAHALGPVRYRDIAGLLLDRTAIMSTMDGRRVRHGWRRQAFRWLIRQGGSRLP